MFYVIEGFLDVILPVTDSHHGSETKIPSQNNPPLSRANGLPTSNHESGESKQQEEGKHLFTVKPGGIAGYLCKDSRELLFGFLLIRAASLCNTGSYVDIKAKTDTCVGYLPHPALERLLEKRPIVLLTLAKRLTSLLSPLGKAPSIGGVQSFISNCDFQSFTSTRRLIGCMYTLAKSCGDPKMSVTRCIS